MLPLPPIDVPRLYVTKQILDGIPLLIQREKPISSQDTHSLSRTLALAGLTTWEWDLESGEFRWRPTPWFVQVGVEGEITFERFLGTVYPDDRFEVTEALNRCVERDVPCEIEYRVPRQDGSIAWIRLQGGLERDGAGRPLRMLGVAGEITARKEREAALELAAQVLEYTPEGVLVTDTELRILTVNPAFTRTTGYSAEEALGNPPSMLSSGRHGRDFYQNMWHALRDRGEWQGEIWNRRKNGDIYPEWLNIAAIRNRAGEVTHYAAVFSDLSSQEQVREQLHRLAYYDVLTGLPNRDLFRDRLTNAAARARRNGSTVGLVFLDLDRFKNVNDSLGHSAGDALLKAVAERLTGRFRESDTIARIGGDEFAIVLADIRDADDAANAAASVLNVLHAPIIVEGHELFASASIGISLCPDDGEDPELLIRNADAAMYRAKSLGRNGYQFYTEEMGVHSAERLVMEGELRRAIERGELSLALQPQIDLATGTICGAEALARWHNERLGSVRPDIFIALAEETGLIGDLGRWVLDASLAEASRWQRAGFTGLSIAVNVSGHQLAGGTLVAELKGALEQHAVPPECVELELTESVLMENAERTVALLGELHAQGVSLAVDDFGTGYSSLAYLKRFDIDKLKIDKSFVNDITLNRSDAEIAATVIAMGHKLGLRVVAEGVETREQLQFLAEQGCDQIQGYLFSRPVTPDELLEMLEDTSRFAALANCR